MASIARDCNGKVIREGDLVAWRDPETGVETLYEVYDEPTEDMVRLWSFLGECEALPSECLVIEEEMP